MTTITPTFRIFVSSTFEDLAEERNALNKAFKRLRALARKRGARFQAIDLRWGVGSEAETEHRTMPICLEELRRCQRISPKLNFIVLLGNRYGWRPLPPVIPGDQFGALRNACQVRDRALLDDWYEKDDNAIHFGDNGLRFPAFNLRPRRGAVLEDSAWEKVERELNGVLDRAAQCHDFPWETRLKYGASATEQEIDAGAFCPEDAAHHTFAYFREIENLDKLQQDAKSDATARQYGNFSADFGPDPEADGRLESLKTRLSDLLKGNVRNYTARWSGSSLSMKHLGKLTASVYLDLRRAMLEELTQRAASPQYVHEETTHRAFAEERMHSFVGREMALQEVRRHFSVEQQGPLVIVGGPGCGKSALMARIAESLRRGDLNGVKWTVVQRFVGVTPAASEGRQLLRSLAAQLQSDRGGELPPDGTFETLVRALWSCLPGDPSRPVCLVLDGLEQLSEDDPILRFGWLPNRLPPDVRVVLSMVNSPAVVAGRWAPSMLPLEDMPMGEAAVLLDHWLADAGRDLTADQRHQLMEAYGDKGLPIHLRLAFETARQWSSARPLAACALPGGVGAILKEFLERLKIDHGPVLVARVLGLLATSRWGLSEDELLDLLSEDQEVLSEFVTRFPRSPDLGPQPHLPVAVWSGLFHALEPYLAEREASGVTVLTFHFKPIRSLVDCEAVRQRHHRILARYFGTLPIRAGGTPNLRHLSERPYHLAEAGMGQELERCLCNLAFLSAKVEAGLIFETLGDCERRDFGTDAPGLPRLSDVLRHLGAQVAQRPNQFAQSLWNTLKWEEKLPAALCALTAEAHSALVGSAQPWIEAMSPPNQPAFRVAFPKPALLASVCLSRGVVAASLRGGEIELRRLADGTLVARMEGPKGHVVALAVNPISGQVALMTEDGQLWLEQEPLPLAPRAGERVLAWHGTHGLIFLREDAALVAWNPFDGKSAVLARAVAAPVRVLRVRDGLLKRSRVLVVAGHQGEQLLEIRFEGEDWLSTQVSYRGPEVVDADLDETEGRLVLLGLDRGVRLVDINTGQVLREMNYLRLKTNPPIGAPARCVTGRALASGLVFLATEWGEVARWNLATGAAEHLEPFASKAVPAKLLAFEAMDSSRQYLAVLANGLRRLDKRSSQIACTSHATAATYCTFVGTGEVVTAGLQDPMVRWSEFPSLRPAGGTLLRRVSALMAEDVRVVLAGTQEGLFQRLTPDGGEQEVNPVCLGAAVVGFGRQADGESLVALADGKVLSTKVSEGNLSYVRIGGTTEIWLKALPIDGEHGMCVLRKQSTPDGDWNRVLTLVSQREERCEEEDVFTTRTAFNGFAIAASGRAIALFGHEVILLRQASKGWCEDGKRGVPVDAAAFLADERLVVAPSSGGWLEVWALDEELPTLAAGELSGQVHCLAAEGNRLVAGFESGQLRAYQFHDPNGPAHSEAP
jgi:hypothetical protein